MPSPKPLAHHPPVQTTSGPVLGFTESAHRSLSPGNKKLQPPVLKFLGIPYAQAARFARPSPPTRWSTPRACFDFGPSFPQQHNPMWSLVHSRSHTGRDVEAWPQDETAAHCANLWLPADPPPQPGEKLPVLVWVYGGGLENGSSEEPVYDAENFVRRRAADGQRCIVVSGNYRTNVFGWACGPGWADIGGEGGLAGNYGLYDVRALLRWTLDNVGAFGGDPDCVTVFGESAGAFIISCLLTHPTRLFDRAILHSGAPGTMPCRPPASSYRPYRKLVERFCPAATLEAARLAMLRAIPQEELLEAHLELRGAGGTPGLTLESGPNAIWDATAQQRLEEGKLSPWVQGVVVGTLEDEGVPFSFQNPQVWRASGVSSLLRNHPQAQRDEAERLFPDDTEGERRRDFTTAPVSRWIHEHTFAVPADMLAEAITAKRTSSCPVYMFRYNTPVEGMKWGSGRSNYGTPHGMELAATFGIERLFGSEGSPAFRAAAEMGRRWVQFAAGEVPGEDWKEWKQSPGAAPENGQWLVFKPDGSVQLEDCPAYGPRQTLVKSMLEDREKVIASRWAEEKVRAAKSKGKPGKL